MKRYVCFAAALLLLVIQVDAACKQEESKDLIVFVCQGGSVADIHQIPNNAEVIRISNMPVGHISEALFGRFGRNLKVLSCSHCMISDIDDRAFRRLEYLEHLNLDNNHLKEVRGAWFEGLTYLTYLDVNYNAIERIDGDVFRHTPELVEMRAAGNRLACLDIEAMARLEKFARIFVNENPNFACPNALKKFLNSRNISLYDPDPQWDSIKQDLVHVEVPPPVLPPQEQELRERYAPTSTPPAYYTRPRYTEPTSPPETTPPPPPPTQPPPPVTQPFRPRPYVPDMIQTSVPAPDGFVYQGQHIAPSVTQQQLDNYRNQAEQAARNSTEELRNKTNAALAITTTEPAETTTECPNSAAGLSRDSRLFAGLIFAAMLSASRWTANEA